MQPTVGDENIGEERAKQSIRMANKIASSNKGLIKFIGQGTHIFIALITD